MLKRATALPWLGLLLLATSVHAATTLDHEIRFAPERFKLDTRNGQADIRVAGAFRETQPGRPDLPVLSERVVLPSGMRVTGVEVVDLGTEPMAGAVRVAPALKMRSDVLNSEPTEPDPAWYRVGGFQPETPVTLGYQGYERGLGVAFLQVRPVRWDAVSGQLQRLTHVNVRLTLEPDTGPGPLKRERIVREWETTLSGIPTRELGAALTSVRPNGRTAAPFKPTQIPSVLGSPVQYVIITTDAKVSEFQRLADWKTQTGTPAVVRTLSFIRAQYPFGVDDADRVRQFIRDAYSRWGTKWVLLGGDTDELPTRYAYTTFYGGENIACDMYFQCLDRNWNADGDSIFGEGAGNSPGIGDSCDLLPEVYVGRAPVSTPQQLTTFVDKSIQYEKTPVGDYENRLLFFAEVLFPQDWDQVTLPSLDGAEIVENDVLPWVRGNPTLKYGRLYENNTDSRWEPGAIKETRVRVLDSLNVGYNVANHVGHGYRNVMSVGDATITNADVMGLTNGSRLSNMYAANCTSNAIDFPCIGEAFMHNPNGGAVTNVGSSRFDFPVVGREYQNEFFRLMYHDSVQAVGELEARQKVPFVAFSTQDFVHRWTQFVTLLLGDPELRVWTGKPRTLTVVHPASMALGDTTVTVNVKIGATPLYQARVTLYKADDDYRSVLTDGAGNAVLDFRPDSTGSATLTVTGYDCRPYQATLSIASASGAMVVETTPQIDDDNAGGTSGNADGLVNGGEVIDLRVPLRNNGSATASSVTATLSTTDGLVSITGPTSSYGSIGVGQTVTGSAFRFSLPYNLPDQREIPFTISITGGGKHWVEHFQITSHTPEIASYSHVVSEIGGGNGNARPDPGETVDWSPRFKNLGSGPATGVTAVIRSYDGKCIITDSTSTPGSIAAGGEVLSDPVRFTVNQPGAVLEMRVSCPQGLLATWTFDLTWPVIPSQLALKSGATDITLTWSHNLEGDLTGYNIYRANSAVGPFTKVNAVPSDRTSYYLDSGLVPLTRYYYRVTAVDSSGNESNQTFTVNETTTPPHHGIFPIMMGQTTPSSVAIARLYQPGQQDIIAGADVLYVWHPDGSSPVDADGDIVNTQGDFTADGSYYAAAPSVADLDGGGMEIIGPTWNSQAVYVFDTAGHVKPGWPFTADTPIWSSAAIGDLDNDGTKEMVFGSNGNNVYALRANGTEWIDGDSNPTTPGVFKNLGVGNNFSTPALADLDRNGQLEIVYAAFNGQVHAWRPNGAELPGWPFVAGGTMSMSPAIGYLDGASDTTLDVVFMSAGGGHDSLYVVNALGQRRAGWPKPFVSGGTSKQPSPVLADMDNDGFLDIVAAGTDGKLYVYDRNGNLFPSFTNVRYSALTSAASESSPVVADITGDGIPDIVMGGEDAKLNAVSGTGVQLPGFPINLGGEVRGAPALCDCDGDGLSEIVLADWDQNLYVWDYDFPFNPNGLPAWPQFHHDAMRTGLANGPTLVGVPSATEPPPTKLEFAAPAPNPVRSSTRLRWAIPASHAGESFDVSVFDLSGRRVQTVASGRATAGRFSAEWDRRDIGGSRVGGGMYFVRFHIGGTNDTHKMIVMP